MIKRNFIPDKKTLTRLQDSLGATAFTLPNYKQNTVTSVSVVRLSTIMRLTMIAWDLYRVGCTNSGGQCSYCTTALTTNSNYCHNCGRKIYTGSVSNEQFWLSIMEGETLNNDE